MGGIWPGLLLVVFDYNLKVWPPLGINFQGSSAVALIAVIKQCSLHPVQGCLLVSHCLFSTKAVFASRITGRVV